ncbi:MAG: amidohydrolase [Bacteroidetes bacterium CG12_big_fil_rev_8_21_14_0_65_60_17]|nr:MAG: amidohydrolase [Bacteroidetes bacterium CG12_big_fil_rev_8_21_14_0_65_60_17]
MMLLVLTFFVALANVTAADTTAFVNVNVLPMDSERVLERHTVLVDGDRIVAVGPVDAVAVPDRATVVDGTGMWLMPGLAEMHGHIPPRTQPREEIEAVLFLYAANGITTVRGMLGWPGQLDLREGALTGQILSPTLYLAGPSFSGQTVGTPEEARERARRQVAEGWDLLKVHPGLDRATYDAMANEARRLGITFGGHVPADVGLEHALEMGQLTFDHMDGYNAHLGTDRAPDPEDLQAIVERTRQAGAWIVPTSVLWELFLGVADIQELTSRPELKYTSAQNVASWTRAYRTRLENAPPDGPRMAKNRKIILKALSDGGVPILMGTDAPQQFSIPGFSLHREVAYMVQAGMTPYEVLVSGTRNVGRYFADKDTFGLVAEGHRADLVLLTANPLEDIRAIDEIEGVMLRGRWMPRAEIDARLAEIEAWYARDH